MDWSRVVEIPNGVDSELFRPRDKDPELMLKHGLAGKKVVLFVGRLQACKGLDVLIDALAEIADDRVVLLVVGGGYADDSYRKQAEEKGVRQRVIFVGPVSHDRDLPLYYNVCDLLVLPSTYMEAFPLVVLEAMASGKPAIVSSLPGPSQLVENGVDGFITPVNDRAALKEKMEYLIANGERSRTMGQAGRKKMIARYSWTDIALRLENAFRSILRKR